MSLSKTAIRILPETIKLIKITDAEYFSAEYKEYISNSKLGLADPNNDGSREKYESGFSSDYSASFELGSAIHAKVLQPEEFIISDIRKPSGKLGLFAEYVYDFRQTGKSIKESILLASEKANYYSGKFTITREKTAIKQSLPFYLNRIRFKEEPTNKVTLYLSDASASKFTKCMDGIERDPNVLNTLRPKGLLSDPECYNEYAIFAEAEVTLESGEVKIVKLKAKLDNFTIDHETQVYTLNDLKTTGKPVSFFMGNTVTQVGDDGSISKVWHDGSFQKYSYYRQMGMYLWLLSCYMQQNKLNYKPKANMVVVETIPEFRTKIYPVKPKDIKKGLDDFKRLLIMVSEWIEKR